MTPANRGSAQVISGINMQQNTVIKVRSPVTNMGTLRPAERRAESPDQPGFLLGQMLEGTEGPPPGAGRAAHT